MSAVLTQPVEIPTIEPLQPIDDHGVSRCPRCGFGVRATTDKLRLQLEEHLADCPGRQTTAEMRALRAEQKADAFFAKKERERLAKREAGQ